MQVLYTHLFYRYFTLEDLPRHDAITYGSDIS